MFLTSLSKIGSAYLVDSFPCPLFCSIGLHICFCAITIVFLLLWLCSIAWRRYCDTSSIALFVQYCLDYLLSCGLPYQLLGLFSVSVMNVIGSLMRIASNM
jgi:hypothetical protein